MAASYAIDVYEKIMIENQKKREIWKSENLNQSLHKAPYKT